jgi:hypothetical protein
MKKLIPILICCVLGNYISFATNIKVKHFAELSRDISNRTEMVKDINDEPCAIVKVIGADASFSFEGTIVKKVYKSGEIWLYVSPGIKRITIKHGSNTLRYDFPAPIEYSVYELALRTQDDFNKVGAIATSCFLPGVGQMAFKNDYVKGSLILAAELGAIGAIVGCNSQQHSFKSKSDLAVTAEDKISYMKTSDNYGTARNIMIGVAAGIYLYNVLDVILAKPRPSRKSIVVNPYVENINSTNFYGVNVSLKF